MLYAVEAVSLSGANCRVLDKCINTAFYKIFGSCDNLDNTQRKITSGHINENVNKAYSVLGIIKRNFSYLTVTSFTLLYKGMVRSHIDYCSSVWAPYKKGDIEMLEIVQKRATKTLSQHRHLSYTDCIKLYKLPIISHAFHRQIRGDMIEVAAKI